MDVASLGDVVRTILDVQCFSSLFISDWTVTAIGDLKVKSDGLPHYPVTFCTLWQYPGHPFLN